VSDSDLAGGGPTRITVRPGSADSAAGDRGGLVAALADFGLGGDANGGVCAWGDADKADMLSWGGGGGGWDSDDSPRQPAPPQLVTPVRVCTFSPFHPNRTVPSRASALNDNPITLWSF
jgi:hypothetical protein